MTSVNGRPQNLPFLFRNFKEESTRSAKIDGGVLSGAFRFFFL